MKLSIAAASMFAVALCSDGVFAAPTTPLPKAPKVVESVSPIEWALCVDGRCRVMPPTEVELGQCKLSAVQVRVSGSLSTEQRALTCPVTGGMVGTAVICDVHTTTPALGVLIIADKELGSGQFGLGCAPVKAEAN